MKQTDCSSIVYQATKIFLFTWQLSFYLVCIPYVLNAQNETKEVPNSKFRTRLSSGQWQLVDRKGSLVDSLTYDSVTSHQFRLPKQVNLFKAWTKGRFYLKNDKGKSMYPLPIEDVYAWNNYLCYAKERETYGLMDSKGQVLCPAKYSHFTADSSYAFLYAFLPGSDGIFELLQANGKRIGLQYSEVKRLKSKGYQLTDIDRQVFLFKPAKDQFLLAGPYRSIGTFIDGLAVVNQSNRMGLIDQNGKELLPVVYQEVKVLGKGHVLARKQPGWVMPNGDTLFASNVKHLGKGWYTSLQEGLWDIFTPNHQLLAYGFEEVSAFHKDYFLVKQKNHWGSVDTNGRERIPILFEEIKPLSPWPYLLARQDSLYFTLFDEQGRKVQSGIQEPQLVIEAGHLWMKTLGFYRAFDLNQGRWLQHRYDSKGIWTGSGYKVASAGRWGLIDPQGNWKIGPIWPKTIEFVSEEHSILPEGYRFSLTDLDGCSIHLLAFDSLSPSGPLVQVWRKGRTGLINIDGEVMFPLIASSIRFLPEWYTWQVQNDTAFGTMSRSGCFVSSFSRQYDSISGFVNQKALVKQRTGWGMIDPMGRLRIAPRYQSLRPFQGASPRAAMQLQDLWGFIDEGDQIAVQPQYTSVEDFRGSIALVYRSDQAEFIDPKGKVLLKPDDRYFWSITGDLIFHQKGKVGLISSEGKRLLEALAMDIKPIGKDHFQIKIGSQSGLMDRTGQWLVQPTEVETFFMTEEAEISYKFNSKSEVYFFNSTR
jgi:hypothetical protein